jgi:hypothetical protein
MWQNAFGAAVRGPLKQGAKGACAGLTTQAAAIPSRGLSQDAASAYPLTFPETFPLCRTCKDGYLRAFWLCHDIDVLCLSSLTEFSYQTWLTVPQPAQSGKTATT